MFQGDDPDLGRVLQLAITTARDLGHRRVGSEHLLLALAMSGPTGGEAETIPGVLARHGVTAAALRDAVNAAAPAGAGVAADRALVAKLGIDLGGLLQTSDAATWDHQVGRAPVFPLSTSSSRRRRDRIRPPLGVDVRAAYEASLRLALARRERRHRPEHLALALVSLDPGVDWLLTEVGADRRAIAADLAVAFPPAERNPLLRAERRLGRRSRHRHLVRRYQRLAGRPAVDSPMAARLIAG